MQQIQCWASRAFDMHAATLACSEGNMSLLIILPLLSAPRKLHVQGCPLTLTGADMYALCSDAWMNGLKRTIEHYEAMQSASKAVPEPETVEVAQEDFWSALSLLQPSLSQQELQRYDALRDQFGQKA